MGEFLPRLSINFRRSRGFRREPSVFRCLLLKATGSPTKALGDDGFRFFRIVIVPAGAMGKFRLIDNLGLIYSVQSALARLISAV